MQNVSEALEFNLDPGTSKSHILPELGWPNTQIHVGEYDFFVTFFFASSEGTQEVTAAKFNK